MCFKLLVLCPIWLTSLESLKFVDTESIVSIFYFIFIFKIIVYATEIDVLGTALPHNLRPALQYDFLYIQHMITMHTLDCTPHNVHKCKQSCKNWLLHTVDAETKVICLRIEISW